jgi:hypothetical protein
VVLDAYVSWSRGVGKAHGNLVLCNLHVHYYSPILLTIALTTVLLYAIQRPPTYYCLICATLQPVARPL